MKLYISTFGGFEIKSDKQSLLEESNRTYKLYKLFQYFLTFRNKKLLPETIMDNLWSDSEFSDPKNVLRTQIFRLRKIISLFVPENEDENKYLNLNFINGYYCLEIGPNTVIDLDEFENLINQGDLEQSKDTENAIILYENAINIYKGLYLFDNGYELWLVPTRNYYHRLYLKTLYKLIEILNEKECYEKIISLCEKALIIEPYEEEIHLNMMKAMLKNGQYKDAMGHFERAELLLEKEMGTKPSQEFLEFSKKIKNNLSYKEKTDILGIAYKLDDRNSDGATYCTFEHFKFLFNIQKMKSARNNQNDYLGIITLENLDNKNYIDEKLNCYSNYTLSILNESLRKGDIFATWNQNQILIILHSINNKDIKKIEERIRKYIIKQINFKNYKLLIEFEPLITEKILL